MEDTRINFDTAKLAKEKGFDWGTNHLDYMMNGNYVGEVGSCISCTSYIKCPTQTQLQKWLREVHDIHINVNVRFHEKHTNSTVMYAYEISTLENYYDGIGDNLNNWIKGLTPTREYNGLFHTHNSYEESLEIGLQEALNLLPNN